MNDFLTIDPIAPWWLMLALCIAVGAWAIRLEFRKKFKLLAIRIFALVLLIISLFIILLNPSTQVEESEYAILLTPNYEKNIVDSLLRINNSLQLYRTQSAGPYPQSIIIADNREWIKHQNKIKYVVGDGMPMQGLDLMDSANFSFFHSEKKGVLQLSLPAKVYVNRECIVKGIINDSAVTKLVLNGPDGKLDSVLLNQPKGKAPFVLSFIPKQAGQFIYSVAVASDEKEVQEQIPVVVEQPRPLKILFIQRFPTFETQYLKQFLSKNNKLVLRYQLSKNIFRHEYVNSDRIELKRLTEQNLNHFDLLVIDSDAFKTLSANEREAVSAEIFNGLGMIVLFNETPSKVNSLQKFLPQFVSTKSDTAELNLGAKRKQFSRWPVTPVQSATFYSLIKTGNTIVSGFQYHGFGKTGFTLLQDTYKTYLEGDSLSYSSLWTDLIEKTSRVHLPPYSIELTTPWPYYADDAITFSVRGAPKPDVVYNSMSIPLKEDVNIENLWHGKVWADKPGWHNITVANDTTSKPFLVHERNAWGTLRSVNTSVANEKFASLSTRKTPVQKQWQPVSLLPFYLTILLAAGFLWLVPKL
jgi:hypothetical protein